MLASSFHKPEPAIIFVLSALFCLFFSTERSLLEKHGLTESEFQSMVMSNEGNTLLHEAVLRMQVTISYWFFALFDKCLQLLMILNSFHVLPIGGTPEDCGKT